MGIKITEESKARQQLRAQLLLMLNAQETESFELPSNVSGTVRYVERTYASPPVVVFEGTVDGHTMSISVQ